LVDRLGAFALRFSRGSSRTAGKLAPISARTGVFRHGKARANSDLLSGYMTSVWGAGQRVPSLDALLEFVMTANPRDAAEPAILSPEAQAATLWTFVQLKAPHFTSADALDVVRDLGDTTQADPKTLARRLQEALSRRRVSLKYTNALQAAARLLGSTSYHTIARDAPPLLQLVSAFSSLNRPIKDWKEGIEQFCYWAEGDQEGGGFHVYQMGFTATSVTMGTPLMKATDKDGRPIPELQLQWSTQQSQLAEAIAGVETLRRRYEETGRAVVDGLAAAYFCLHNPHGDAHPLDPVNSELVVVEVAPGPSAGTEVARGDEVKCWAELEAVHPKDRAPSYSLNGATWVVEKCRYQWQLSTVRMDDGKPLIVNRPLTEAESAKLFRRHQNAVNNQRYFVPEDRVKALSSVATAGDEVELDGGQLRKYLSDEFARAMAPHKRVPVSTLVKLAAHLKLSDPSVLVRKPKRSDLSLLRDDELLRTFISRVHDVVYEVPRGLRDEAALEVDRVVDQLLTALKNDVVLLSGEVHDAFPRQAPYMTYANQGKDMLERLKDLGLVVYAGVFTTVKPFRARTVREHNIKTSSSLKVERVLFLDVDFAQLVD
jgi:hypothetical protein